MQLPLSETTCSEHVSELGHDKAYCVECPAHDQLLGATGHGNAREDRLGQGQVPRISLQSTGSAWRKGFHGTRSPLNIFASSTGNVKAYAKCVHDIRCFRGNGQCHSSAMSGKRGQATFIGWDAVTTVWRLGHAPLTVILVSNFLTPVMSVLFCFGISPGGAAFSPGCAPASRPILGSPRFPPRSWP